MKTQVFDKKSKTGSEKNVLANFFFYHRFYQSSGNKLYGFKRFFETYCAKDKMISLGSKRPINKFFKKSYLLDEKNLTNFFSFCQLWQT